MDKPRLISLLKGYRSLETLETRLIKIGFNTVDPPFGKLINDVWVSITDAICDVAGIPKETWNEKSQTGYSRDGWMSMIFHFGQGDSPRESAKQFADRLERELEVETKR